MRLVLISHGLNQEEALASELLDTHLPLQTRLSNINPSITAPTFSEPDNLIT